MVAGGTGWLAPSLLPPEGLASHGAKTHFVDVACGVAQRGWVAGPRGAAGGGLWAQGWGSHKGMCLEAAGEWALVSGVGVCSSEQMS